MASDFIVVGGGLVGAAVSHGLVKAGASVTVLDEGDNAFRASRGNFGLVWVQSKGDGMPEYATWSRKSSDLWPDFAAALGEETGINVGHHRPGGLELCLDTAEYETYQNSITRMHNQPGVGDNDRRMIDGDDVRRMEPNVGPEVVGASFCPHDGVVNPLHTLSALHEIIIGAGADYRPDHRAERIIPDGGGFRVMTRNDAFTGGKVVLAAGNGNQRLGPDVGLDIPTGPERGHIIVTERTRPLFNHVLGQIRQTDEGTVMLGATKENVGFDTGFNLAMAAEVAARAVRKVPALKQLRMIRGWSALRIMSPDGFPVYEESAAHPGAFVVTCHSGVTLAAAHALALAPKLLEPGFNDHFAAFSPRRFDVSKTD
jgi:glycine/D-amino acid oxidase-like deaminating enzyme